MADEKAGWQLDASHVIAVRRRAAGLALEPAVARRGTWRRATAGDGTAAAFAAALAGGASPPPGFRLRIVAPVPVCGADERAVGVDQTNESVIVGGQLIVKWMSRPQVQPHQAPALLEHLVRVGFRRMPEPYAALWWSRGDQEALMALVARYLPDARDGWDWCVEDLLAEWEYGQRAFFPGQLGALAADLHAALATPSVVFPVPAGLAGAGETELWGKQAAETVDAAIAETPGPDGVWLRDRASRLHADVALPAIEQTPVLRIHGDLHVGQVLRWRGGLAVTDFDGNPTIAAADAQQPAARDVAQLMTSLAHVAAVADKRTGFRRTGSARAFAARAGAEFLVAYRSRLAAHDSCEVFDERLLHAFAVEQEARELVYAARFLPRWAYAPMTVLRSWYP